MLLQIEIGELHGVHGPIVVGPFRGEFRHRGDLCLAARLRLAQAFGKLFVGKGKLVLHVAHEKRPPLDPDEPDSALIGDPDDRAGPTIHEVV